MAEYQTPLEAIKQFCFECSGESKYEVKRCSSDTCPLKPYRFGKNPFRKGREMTAEQIEEAKQRLAKAREKKQEAKV